MANEVKITYFVRIGTDDGYTDFQCSPTVPESHDDFKANLQTQMGKVLEVEQAKDPAAEFISWYSHDDHGVVIETSDVLVIPV